MARLSSENLKKELWGTLLDLRAKRINPDQANAIAAQARELMRVVKMEVTIMKAQGRKPGRTLIGSTTTDI